MERAYHDVNDEAPIYLRFWSVRQSAHRGTFHSGTKISKIIWNPLFYQAIYPVGWTIINNNWMELLKRVDRTTRVESSPLRKLTRPKERPNSYLIGSKRKFITTKPYVHKLKAILIKFYWSGNSLPCCIKCVTNRNTKPNTSIIHFNRAIPSFVEVNKKFT